jgi:hypothetical protein
MAWLDGGTRIASEDVNSREGEIISKAAFTYNN